MASNKSQKGDIYGCIVNDSVRCFQYICDDSSQLGSQVIAVFAKKFANNDEIKSVNLASLEIEFFAHVFIAFGIKLKSWTKIYNAPLINWNEIIFRSTNDYGKPNVTQSDDWWVWEINGPKKHIGSLAGEARKSFIGVVMAPPNIIARLSTGKYSYVYPAPIGDEPYWE